MPALKEDTKIKDDDRSPPQEFMPLILIRAGFDKISTCPAGQLAKNSTSPSQKYHLSFLIIVKQGHSSSRTSLLRLKSSFPDFWSSRTIGRGQFRALGWRSTRPLDRNVLVVLYTVKSWHYLATSL